MGKSVEITQLKLFREQILNLNNGVTSYVNLPEPLCSSNLITLSFKVSNYFIIPRKIFNLDSML